MSPEEARRHALLRFGNPTVISERVAATDISLVIDSVWRDIRYALRQLLQHPGFTITAIMTLALGIGANVVVFSVLNALILRPLNVADPQSLYNVEHKEHGSYFQSYPDYLDYRDRNSTFSGMAAYDTTKAAITLDITTRNFGYLASGNYFDMLGVQPALGRLFHLSDEHGIDSAPYIVLSYDFWQARFNGDSHCWQNDRAKSAALYGDRHCGSAISWNRDILLAGLLDSHGQRAPDRIQPTLSGEPQYP